MAGKRIIYEPQRFNYDTSSSDSADKSETNAMAQASKEPIHAHARTEVQYIEVVRRECYISEGSDVASHVTELSGMEVLDVDQRFPLIQRSKSKRKLSGDSPSMLLTPPSLHRETTVPMGNLVPFSAHSQSPPPVDLEMSSSTKLARIITCPAIAIPPTPPMRKSSLVPNGETRPQLRPRQPSPNPETDQPSLPIRKMSPNSQPYPPSHAHPPARKSYASKACESGDKFPSLERGKYQPLSWRTCTAVDFSGRTKVSPPTGKLPRVAHSIGQRRWQETGPTLGERLSAEDRSVPSNDRGSEAGTVIAHRKGSDSISTDSVDDMATADYVFDNRSWRVSSLTCFLTSFVPRAPGETTEDCDKQREGNWNQCVDDERATDSNDDQNQIWRSACGQTIPGLVCEDITIGQAVSVDAFSPPFPPPMPSASSSDESALLASSSDASALTKGEMYFEALPSMVTIPDIEVSSLPTPNLHRQLQQPVTPKRTLTRWPISWVLQSLISHSLPSQEQSVSIQHAQLTHADDEVFNNGSVASRTAFRSLITARWSLVLPTRRLESSIKPLEVKCEQTNEEIPTARTICQMIYGLAAACLVLSSLIVILAIILASKEDSAASMSGKISQSFPSSSPTEPFSISPTAGLPLKPVNDFIEPRS